MGKAEFSRCKKYRYWLERELDPQNSKILLIVGLNPSTADAKKDDHTIRRCQNFARSWGYGRLWVANLFAYRSTDPSELRKIKDPIGPQNDEWLKKLHGEAHMTLIAWGNEGELYGRHLAVLDILGETHCLGVTKANHPRHPLYVKASQSPILFERIKA